MNAIFLNSRPERVASVYDAKNLEKIREIVDLDETVYSLEMVKAEPEKFRDVKYIFSTWGMEAPDEEQIRSFFPALEAVFYGAGTVQKFARQGDSTCSARYPCSFSCGHYTKNSATVSILLYQ